VLLFLSAGHTGTVDAFPFGAVMLIVLAKSTATAFAHRHAVVKANDARPSGEAAPTAADPAIPAAPLR
jgi:hypothetical protein